MRLTNSTAIVIVFFFVSEHLNIYAPLDGAFKSIIFELIDVMISQKQQNCKFFHVEPAVNRQPGFRRGAVEQSALNNTHNLREFVKTHVILTPGALLVGCEQQFRHRFMTKMAKIMTRMPRHLVEKSMISSRNSIVFGKNR